MTDRIELVDNQIHFYIADQHATFDQGKTIWYEHRDESTGWGYVWDPVGLRRLCIAPFVRAVPMEIPHTEEEVLRDYPEMNVAYAMETVNPEPILVVEMEDKSHRVIDGWHRLYRSKRLGQTTIAGYLIPWGIARDFLLAKIPPDRPLLGEALHAVGLGDALLT